MQIFFVLVYALARNLFDHHKRAKSSLYPTNLSQSKAKIALQKLYLNFTLEELVPWPIALKFLLTLKSSIQNITVVGIALLNGIWAMSI